MGEIVLYIIYTYGSISVCISPHLTSSPSLSNTTVNGRDKEMQPFLGESDRPMPRWGCSPKATAMIRHIRLDAPILNVKSFSLARKRTQVDSGRHLSLSVSITKTRDPRTKNHPQKRWGMKMERRSKKDEFLKIVNLPLLHK
jgi:hypothetical protein